MQQFVGVVDSGIGGLTILQSLKKQYPNTPFVYLADHAFCPYGNLPTSLLQSRAMALTNYLASNGATTVVFACNTISRFAQSVSNGVGVQIVDVITCTCNSLASLPNARKLALLATRQTLQGKTYCNFLRNCGVVVRGFDCSSLVPCCENAQSDACVTNKLRFLLRNLPRFNADVILLGCTHFPLLQRYFLPYRGNATIIKCSCRLGKNYPQTPLPAPTIYLTTGNANKVNAVVSNYFDVSFVHVTV